MKEQDEWTGDLEHDIYQEIVRVTQPLPVKEQRAIQKALAEMVTKAQDKAFMKGYEYAIEVLENGRIKNNRLDSLDIINNLADMG